MRGANTYKCIHLFTVAFLLSSIGSKEGKGCW
jgi:hypothetical protein